MHRFLAALPALLIIGTGAAFAEDKPCSAPRDQWQPQQVLNDKLTADGWSVKRIKIEDGCYEVYALDADGKRIESYFDPKTLARLPSKKDD